MRNPYNYHLPVRDDAMFFGRAELLSDLSSGLAQPVPLSAAVFGGRRFGKTSLLRKLQRDMAGQAGTSGNRRLIPWYYDPQAGYPIACDDDFFLLVLEGLRTSICEEMVPQALVEDTYVSELRRGAGLAFEVCFRMLIGEAGQRVRLVMLIDEAEALLTAPWGAELRPVLRRLLSNSTIVDSLALVMAGSTAFHTQVAEKDSPLENILTRYSLNNLTHGETLALAREPNQGLFRADAAEEVWRQTGGHPCLVQFIMQELWRDVAEATVENVQDIASTFPERLNHFESWRAALSPLAHAVYRWIATQDAPPSFGGIRRRFAIAGGADLLHAWNALGYHGVIAVTGAGRSRQFATAGQMFRDWFLGDLAAHAVEPISQRIAHAARAQQRVQPLTHETFDIKVETQGQGRYEIQVLYAPAGPARSAGVSFEPGAPDLQALLRRVEIGDEDAALLTSVGERLHAFLFPYATRTAFIASREVARSRDRGLCIKLRLSQPDLAALPWELLYDPQEQRFLALSGFTPLVRFLPGVLGAPLPPVSPPWRLLIVTATPTDWPTLQAAREREAILQALQPLVRAGRLRVETIEHATLAALLGALRTGVHWLHFIGHAEYNGQAGRGALILERSRPRGTGERVDVDTLRQLLPETYARSGARLRMVFLNACATAQVGVTPGTRGLAQTLVRAGIPTAIGMGRPIADASARAFSAGFYGALADKGWPFYLAVAEGRRRVVAETGLHGGDWAVPVLFTGASG
jgi:hypothetical protein